MKLFVVALIFLGAILLAAMGLSNMSKEEPPDPGRFHDEMNGYSILFPEGWRIEREHRGNTVTALCPASGYRDKFYTSISVSVEELAYQKSLLQFTNELGHWMSKEHRSLKKQDQGKEIINDQEARWVIYEFETGEGQMKTLAYCLIRGKRGYTIACNCEPYKFDALRATLESAARSFKFES